MSEKACVCGHVHPCCGVYSDPAGYWCANENCRALLSTEQAFRSTSLAAGERHPNSARFHAILSELGTLHDKKQADYGRGDDPFANVRASTEFGVPAWVGAMVRANDKIRRLQTYALNGRLANEGVEDSLRDLAVYAVIALVLFEQEKGA